MKDIIKIILYILGINFFVTNIRDLNIYWKIFKMWNLIDFCECVLDKKI